MNPLLFLFLLLATSASSQTPPDFRFEISPVPAQVKHKASMFSHRPSCPLPLEDLAYIRLSHWGMDNTVHEGELLVHHQVAQEMVDIFRQLFEARFPIEKMKLIDTYQGQDDASMADNNTSAFNCRKMTGNSRVFSQHSLGLALDVNPRLNPHVLANGKVRPEEGKAFLDRSLKTQGLLREGDLVVRAFMARGWTWGGFWKKSKDYQHFEKVLNLNHAQAPIPSTQPLKIPRKSGK